MKRAPVIILVLLAVGISAGAYYMRGGGREPQVTTAQVTRGDIVDTVGATGTLEAVTTVQVGTQVSGTVQELYADFNSIVRKGQVIARLDPSLMQTQIEQQQANVARAQADLERLRVSLEDARVKLTRATDLSNRSLIPKTELEAAEVNVRSTEAQLRSAQAGLTQARANLNQTQVNLQHTVIHAPIDGIVISRNVDVGQTVAASMQAPTLYLLAADLTKMKVNANIDEADVGRIRPGQTVHFRVDAYPTDDFLGTVSQIRLQPVVVQNVVTYATVIDVPNPELKLKPGMTANVTIEIARRSNVVRVPTMALRFRPMTDTFAALGQEVPPELRGRGAAPVQTAAAPAGAPAASGATGTQGQPLRGTPGPGTTTGNGSPSAQTAPRATGDGRPSSNGAGQGGDPEERRRRFQERMQNMSPEEREQFTQRMRERGLNPGGPGQGAGGQGGQANRQQTGRAQAQPQATAPGPSTGLGAGAQTIDQLFGPLPQTETSGRVWTFANKQLKPIRLRLGVSDGTWTELLGSDLQPGTELVTGVIIDQPAAAGAGGPRSPLMPGQRPPNMGGQRNTPAGGGGNQRGR
ncbi:MAG: efflux RND transporter periplasmic adaptor subunit [Vicinamibacterales bacterium]